MRALGGVKAQPSNIGVERTRPGTVNALIASYYALVFPTLKRSTQKSRRSLLERFRREHGEKPVARLEPSAHCRYHRRQGSDASDREQLAEDVVPSA